MSLSMAIVVILVIVVLALVVFFVRRAGPAPDKEPATARPAKASETTAFHAVSIKFASSACSAAKSLKGKRYLSSAAPRIPLPECDVLECTCRFVHHKDRRDGDDRRNSYSRGFAGETGKHPVEQRKRPDRRKQDDTF